MANSTRSAPRRKRSLPALPAADFPLRIHRNGQWYRKYKGSFYYFGKIKDDPDGARAVEAWNAQKDDIFAGKPVQKKSDAGSITLRELVNAFLTDKRHQLDAGEITSRTFGEYYTTCERLLDAFGKERAVSSLGPDDFTKLRAGWAKTRGIVSIGNEIARVRALFRWAVDDEARDQLIEREPKYGSLFKRPAAKVLRKMRTDRGVKMFEADELRLMLDALAGKTVAVAGAELTLPADPTLRAMVLLAANAAFGQGDLAELPMSALDLERGWVTFPRPKTGVARRAKLWPETVEAIRLYLEQRPKPRHAADRDIVFLLRTGRRVLRHSTNEDPAKWAARTDAVARWFGKLMRSLALNGHRGVYCLRHGFQTIGERSRDLPAVRHVMGHSDASISETYRERVDDDRLEHVAAVVHAWLWPAAPEGGAA